jgi:hypothetical protein
MKRTSELYKCCGSSRGQPHSAGKAWIAIVAIILPLIVLILPTQVEAQEPSAQPAAGDTIGWQVISSGGTKGTSANFVLNGTVGQTAVGYGSSTNYGLSHGFWQEFGLTGACCDSNEYCFVTTEANCQIAGGTYKGDGTMCSSPFPNPPNPCCCNTDGRRGDVNMSGSLNVADVTYLTAYLKQKPPGSPAPPCLEEADVNCSGTVNVADVTYLAAYLKQKPPGSPPPCLCDCSDCTR